MSAMTRKYIEKFKDFKGTVDEFIARIPRDDMGTINITQLRIQCRRIYLKRA